MTISRRSALAGAIAAAAASAAAPSAIAATASAPMGRLRRYLDRAAIEDDFSGVVIVEREVSPLLARAWGYADRDHLVPNRLDTRFNLASIGKMFTAAAVLRFVAAGRLRLSTSLAEALPEYPGKASAARITIEHLLSHSSGLPNFEEGHYAPDKSILKLTDTFKYFADKPLDFEPGSQSGYSNTGFLVLGMIVERLSGMSFDAHLEASLFRPLGMRDTGIFRRDRVLARRATGYWRHPTEPGVWNTDTFVAGLTGGPAGGGYSTGPDLARFTQAWRAGQVLAPPLRAEAERKRWNAPREGYGLGVELTTAGGIAIKGHSGGHYGCAGELMMFDNGWTAIILSNSEVDGYWGAAATLKDLLAGPGPATAAFWRARELARVARSSGIDAGRLLAAAPGAVKPRLSVMEVEAAKYRHRGDPAAAARIEAVAAQFRS